jgi:hypothetical protein
MLFETVGVTENWLDGLGVSVGDGLAVGREGLRAAEGVMEVVGVRDDAVALWLRGEALGVDVGVLGVGVAVRSRVSDTELEEL